MTTLHASETTVEIKDATYAVEGIEAGECGQSAVRLVKLVSGEAYDLVRTEANVLECTCPDFVCRHEGKGTCCKHLAFAVANGLLPVVEARPVTSQDVKRARYFGLNIPKPVAKGVGTVDTPMAPIAAAVDEVLGRVLERILGLASDDESACPVAGDDHRGRAARFVPGIEDEAYWQGYTLRLEEGISAEAPSGWRFMRQSAFRLGQADGLLERHRREDREREAQLLHQERMADAFGGPGDGWHDSERVRAAGCIEARLA